MSAGVGCWVRVRQRSGWDGTKEKDRNGAVLAMEWVLARSASMECPVFGGEKAVGVCDCALAVRIE